MSLRDGAYSTVDSELEREARADDGTGGMGGRNVWRARSDERMTVVRLEMMDGGHERGRLGRHGQRSR